MTDMHKGSLLPIKNRVISVDEDTTFLAHYDINAHDALHGIEAIGKPTAFYFDGSTYMRVANPLRDAQVFTIAFWMKHDTPAAWSDVFTLDGGDEQTAMRLEWDGGVYRWYGNGVLQNGGRLFEHDGSKWDHIAIVYDTQNAYVYQNGEVVYSKARVVADMTNSGAINIGMRLTQGNTRWKGAMHSFVLYKQALSQEDVRNIFNNIIPKKDLVAYWEMTQANSHILTDSSPSPQDGMVIGNVKFTNGNAAYTLHPQDGQFGGGIAVEEATVNTMTGYLSSFANLKIGESHSSVVKEGEIKVTRTGEHRFFAEYLSDVTYGILNLTNQTDWPIGKQTISAYITKYYEAPGTTGRFGIGRSSSGNPSLHGYESLGRKSYVISDSSDLGNIRLGLRSGDTLIKAGSYIEWEFLQLEQKSFATSFVNGQRAKGLLAYPKEIFHTESFTFNAWVKLNAHVGGAAQPIFELSSSDSHRFMISHQSSTKKLGVWNTDKQDILSDVIPPINEWYMVTLTFDGTIYKLYYNGAVIASANRGAYAPQTQDKLYIGGHHVGNLNGLIDEVRIDQIVRTEEEILAWYESNSPFWPRGIYRKSY